METSAATFAFLLVANTVLTTTQTHTSFSLFIGLGDGPISDSIFDSNEEAVLKNLDMACGKEMLGEVFIQVRVCEGYRRPLLILPYVTSLLPTLLL